MNCNVIRENMIAFRDRELDEKTAEEVQNHLLECAECRQENELISEFFKSYDCVEKIEITEEFIENTLEKCGTHQCNQTPGRSSIARVWEKITLCAAAVLILLFSYTYIFKVDDSWMELMKISKSVQETLNDIETLEELKPYGRRENSLRFSDSNYQRVEFLVSENSATGNYELIEIKDGRKEVLFSRNNPFHIEFRLIGKQRIDYSIRLETGGKPIDSERLQMDSIHFLNNTGI